MIPSNHADLLPHQHCLGAFFYNPKEDALRVKVKPVPIDNEVEWLRYEFTDQKENSAKSPCNGKN